MDSQEWKERYIIWLIEAGMQPDFAAEIYEAGKPHDEENRTPEDAADDEMGYMEEDDPESGW